MKRKTIALASVLAWAGSLGHAFASDGVSPRAAFETLKGLAGRWEGSVGTPDGPRSTVEFRVTAAGNMVLETQFPGAPEVRSRVAVSACSPRSSARPTLPTRAGRSSSWRT